MENLLDVIEQFLSLSDEKLEELSDILTAYISDNDLDLTGKTVLYLDEELHLPELTLDTLKSFEKLAPFGMDNKKPIFYLKDFKVDNTRTMGAGNSHLKLKISQGDATFEVVAFGQGSLATEFAQTKNLELAVSLSVNKWNGQTSLQLMLVDARVDGIQLFNIRSKNATLPDKVPVLPIFKALEKYGKIKHEEMFEIFNMGVGLMLAVSPENVSRVKELLDEPVYEIGRIVKKENESVIIK